MACTNCNEPNPCTTPTCTCAALLGSECLHYSGEGIECLGITTGMELTETIDKLGEGICAFTPTPSTTTLINVGAGEEVYEGDNEQGQKQLKTFTAGDGIILTPSSTDIQVAVDPDYISENAGSLIFENIVEFDTADPNSGSPTFEPDQPEEDDILYWSSVNNTNWKWNGTAYVLANSNPEATAWFLANTANDAGGNKGADIIRRGAIGIGVAAPLASIHTNAGIRQGSVLSSLLKADVDGDIVAAVAGTDYLTPTGSAAGLTSFPTLNQNTTGNAATVTTNANLNGDITSVGNTTTITPTGVVAGTYTAANITVNAKGQLTAASNGGGARSLWQSFTDSTTVTTTLTTLYTYTLPLNTLVTNGDRLVIEYGGKLTTSADTDLTIGIGSNDATISFTVQGSIKITAELIRKSASTCVLNMFMSIGKSGYDTYCEELTVSGWNSNQSISFKAQVTSGAVTAQIGSITYVPAAV